MLSYTERNVYGGISEDDKLRGKAQVLYSENVDISSNSDYYTVSVAPDVMQVVTDDISIIFQANNYVFFCDEDRNLYRVGVLTPVWTAERIVGTWETSEWLYLIDTSEDIWRISLTNVTQSDWTTYIEMVNDTITSSTGLPIIDGNEGLTYIGLGNTITVINNTTGATEDDGNLLSIDGKIVGMSLLESTLQIFTEKGKYYLRDKIPGGEMQTKDLGLVIGKVVNIANVNYIISGGVIYTLNGYNLQKVVSNPFSDTLDNFKYELNTSVNGLMDYSEGMFYIAVRGQLSNQLSTPLNEYEFGKAGVMTFGVKKDGMPSARNVFISKIGGQRISFINFVYTKMQTFNNLGKSLFFGYELEDGTYGLAEVNLGDIGGTVGENGLIIYNTFDGGIKEIQKELHSLKIRADIKSGTDDAIYVCTVDGDGDLQWFNSTKELSRIDETMLSPDGFYHITPDGTRVFNNINIALILDVDSPSRIRRESIKVYSLTYDYETVRQ